MIYNAFDIDDKKMIGKNMWRARFEIMPNGKLYKSLPTFGVIRPDTTYDWNPISFYKLNKYNEPSKKAWNIHGYFFADTYEEIVNAYNQRIQIEIDKYETEISRLRELFL